ncbi:MAG: phosphoenolpyruvate carboxykinase (GTP) [Actinobacteria bacterium]|nr:phosphoenolpyruvate carboxykinase (GTP) [Actinomycetota bacterium]
MAAGIEAIKNRELLAWLKDVVELCKPDDVYICDGSAEEYAYIVELGAKHGTFTRLNEDLRPNCVLTRSHPSDVARVEDRTFICTKEQIEAGPTNNWVEASEMKKTLREKYRDCMTGRTMFVIPFSMGPVGSPFSKIGIEVTDSAYVVANMMIMTRVGTKVLEALGTDGEYIPCLHSVGAPLQPSQEDVPWPCENDPANKYITHFPEDPSIWSYGSGYGGNALLGKKCLALRIASALARKEGWLAEHMLILCLTSPEGKKHYITGAFPSACGKTNLAMMQPTLPGWKVTCLGDDIAWMHIGEDGRLYAMNPETGFFGVAPGTSFQSNPNAMETFTRNSIFTNAGLTDDGDIWWEDMGIDPPAHLIDWEAKDWTPDSGRKAAHPNARFTSPAEQCPVIDPDWEKPGGVPISAILFGGRRASTVPLVYESLSWEHGVFMGSAAGSETTAANLSKTGVLRHDPFAMLPFCGYNMGDYFAHWLSMAKRTDPSKLPRVFFVNWFRKGDDGHFLWPGYGENSRVLKWIFERVEGGGQAVETPIGAMPTPEAIDLSGIDVPAEDLKTLLAVDVEAWKAEAANLSEYYDGFGERLPAALRDQLRALQDRLDGR